MLPMSTLLACPSCACHVERIETECPHCGATIERSSTGSVARTAGAVVLGLAVATSALAACGDDVQSDYGAGASVPEGGGPVEGGGNAGGSSAGGAPVGGGTAGAANVGGSGGSVQSDYGAAPSD
jgi:hypothetical protein